jgi:uncharacterized C2H2 Zn-finger protein
MSSLDECDEFLECPHCSRMEDVNQYWAGYKIIGDHTHRVYFNSDKYVQSYESRNISCPKVNINVSNNGWAKIEDLNGIYKIRCETCGYLIEDNGSFELMLNVARKSIEKHEAEIHVKH